MPVHLLSDVDVIALSIVDKGANRKRFYMRKQEDGDLFEEVLELPGGTIIKADDDWSVVYCVVAEPGARESPGLGAQTDLEDEWAGEDEIRHAAHRFMKNGALVNRMHETLEPYGRVVENFVAQTDMWINEDMIKAGSWVVGLEPTDEGRAAIESGEFTGVSIQGTGVRTLQKDAPGNEGPKAKKCPSCGGTVRYDKGTCQNCGHSFKVKKAVLSTKGRKNLPSSAFVFPKEKRYPIHDRAHAANALARASGKPEEAKVRAAVCRRYPDMPACRKSVRKSAKDPKTRAAAAGPLRHLIAHYMKKPHPFTSCYRDQVRHGLTPDLAKRRCATLKDLGTGTTKWRHGPKKITKVEDVPDWMVKVWVDRWLGDGHTPEDAAEVLKVLEASSGTVRSDMQTSESGLLRAIAKALGVSKEDIEECDDSTENQKESEAVDTATAERLTKMEEAITKSASQVEGLANRIADIAEALAAKKKDEEEEGKVKKSDAEQKEELTKKLDDVATSLDNLRDEVEKLAEGTSTQESTNVKKSDDPLAGVLLGDF